MEQKQAERDKDKQAQAQRGVRIQLKRPETKPAAGVSTGDDQSVGQ